MSYRKPFYELTPQGRRKRLKKLQAEAQTTEDSCAACVQADQQFEDPHPENILNIQSDDSVVLTDSSDSVVLIQNNRKNYVDECSEVMSPSSSQLDHSITPVGAQSVFDILNKYDSDDIDDDDDDEISIENETQHLQKALRNWSVQFAINNVALSALLCILKTHTCFGTLPLDARTLKETPSSVPLKTVHPGCYCHIGIGFGLRRIWSQVTESLSSIELIFGIDGLPLFGSSASEVWPILGSVFNIPSIRDQVFPVGIYHGKSKPSSTDFLIDFVNEIIDLIKNGIELSGKKISVALKGICCDAPAKAFILGIKSHTGYSSCTRCKQRGYWIDNRMSFPEMDCEARSHTGFLAREDEDFHVGVTPLTNIPGLNLVSSFPLDYMHLVCLGVMRTMLFMWMSGKLPFKFQSRVISTISSTLVSLQRCIPYEFCRKPRSLNDLKRWKATEYRQFLIYTGPLVLKIALLPENRQDIYNLFISLHISMTILLSPSLLNQYKDYANNLLRHFVKTYEGIYGRQFITHNFHGLTHIADDTTFFGPLDSCSAFKFENFLYTMKKLVRKGDKPLQQIVKRLGEMYGTDIKFHPFSRMNTSFNHTTSPQYMKPHCQGPLFTDCDSSRQFKMAQFLSFRLSNSRPDNCCCLSDGSIVLISNFIFSHGLNTMVILCQKFEKVSDFYGEPFCPSSSLGIFKVENLSPNTFIREVSLISHKLVFLSIDNYNLVVPLLHCE